MNPDDAKHLSGGPAFPLPLGTGNLSEPSESGGMTLRDYFAAKAMQSLVKLYALDTIKYGQNTVAWQAYQMADAMLAAREAQ